MEKLEQKESEKSFLSGLLSDIPRKNGETIEDSVPGTNNQRLQSLLTGIQWDHQGANQERVEQMRIPCDAIAKAQNNVSLGDGVLIYDDKRRYSQAR